MDSTSLNLALSPALNPALGGWVAALLGLLVGSFLNVVVYRLPQMLERRWQEEYARACAEPAEDSASTNTAVASADTHPLALAPLNLAQPRSHCPACKTPIAWQHNIPVISWLWLRGRCAHCSAHISLRYPVVELLTAALFVWCYGQTGHSANTVAGWVFVSALMTLSLIDWDTTLLPDDITLPLLWAGLCAAALGWTTPALIDALWGAVAGYLSLWAVYWLFKLITGKEGMGYGDFKLLAALGAWLGWPALLPVVLIASTAGAVVGLCLKYRQQLRAGGYVPFGPFLALGGLTTWMVGVPTLFMAFGL